MTKSRSINVCFEVQAWNDAKQHFNAGAFGVWADAQKDSRSWQYLDSTLPCFSVFYKNFKNCVCIESKIQKVVVDYVC